MSRNNMTDNDADRISESRGLTSETQETEASGQAENSGTSDAQDLANGLKDQINSYWDKKDSDGEGTTDTGMHEKHHSLHNPRKKPKEKKAHTQKKPIRIIKLILLIFVIFVAAVVVTFLVLDRNGLKQLLDGNVAKTNITGDKNAELDDGGKTVYYKGHKYTYNDNLATILCMGIDKTQFNKNGSYQQGGQADTIFLVVVDTKKATTTMIPISRYTMVAIDEYNADGTYWRQNEVQVLLAYTYGDGKDASCKNVSTAISRLMYGMPISDYLAIDMSGISVLNDAIGGVKVQVLEDLTQEDPQLKLGSTVTLKGQQAETYVRSRKSEGPDLVIDNNAPRMERQVQYLNLFMKKMLSQTKTNPLLPLNLLNMSSKYTITNISTSEITYLSGLLAQHGFDNTIVNIPGTAKKGKYTEVYVDNDKLYQVILDVFYNKVS